MSGAKSLMRQFAERLVAHEAGTTPAAKSEGPVAFRVCEKLRPHLATLMGAGGFRALLSRALSLTHADVPWLRGLMVNPDGSLAGLEELRAQLAPEEITEGSVVLLTQLLALLAAFVGEHLTVRLVSEVWPKLPRSDSGLGNGEKT